MGQNPPNDPGQLPDDNRLHGRDITDNASDADGSAGRAGPGDTLWVLGNLTIDDVILPDGTTAMGLCGGNVTYAALGARLWRSRVALAARIGPDFPAAHLERLERAGLELHLVQVTVPSIHNRILYEPNDARQLTTWVGSGSHHDQSIRAIELPARIGRAGACHVAPMPIEIQAQLVGRLRRKGVCMISLDPHEDYIAGHEDALLALVRGVDLFLPSRAEARLLYGRDDPEAAARAFVAAGPQVVVIKLGPAGSIVCGPDGADHHVPAVSVRVVDPTGAGDAYCGGFLAAYHARPDAVLAAVHGAISASFAVERRGALALIEIDPAESRDRLEKALADITSTVIATDRPPLPSTTVMAPPAKEPRHAHG